MSGEGEGLSALQRWMQGAILDPGQAAHAETIRARIAPSPSLAPEARLAIYQRGYVARLVQCMEGQFKSLRHTLGQALFADFVTEYLRAHPSRSATLSELGARFPRFLEETRPDADLPPGERERWVDFMIDLGRYEWALYVTLDAEGCEGTPLADASTPDANLRLQPSVSLHRYAFPVDAYHHGVAAGHDPDVPEPGDVRVAILRRDFRIGIFRLGAPQYDCLLKVQAGLSIGAALREAADAHGAGADEAAEAWSRWRGRWIEQGFFVG